MTIAHYDALTARAFDRLDASFDAGQMPARETYDDAIARRNQRMNQISRATAAIGRALFHAGIWGGGMLALWLNASH